MEGKKTYNLLKTSQILVPIKVSLFFTPNFCEMKDLAKFSLEKLKSDHMGKSLHLQLSCNP
jgi:hypothetical protein